MTERIDHAAEARAALARSVDPTAVLYDTAEPEVGRATAHALLALVEQQRIANVIALSQAQDGNGWQAEQPLDALFAYRREAGYTHPFPEDGFDGLHIRPEIAVALGINSDEEKSE